VVLPNNSIVLSSEMERNFSIGCPVRTQPYRGKCNVARVRTDGWQVSAKRVETGA
jgi:hypothetical protein